jgi:hypothetical protein
MKDVELQMKQAHCPTKHAFWFSSTNKVLCFPADACVTEPIQEAGAEMVL